MKEQVIIAILLSALSALFGGWLIHYSETIKTEEGELYRFSKRWKGFVVLLSAGISAYLVFTASHWVGAVVLAGIASLFATQFAIDLKYMELANEWNLLLGILSVAYLVIKQPESLKAHLLAWLILVVLFFLWWAFLGGLGFGDVKFLLATGFLLTMDQLLIYLAIALFIAVIFGLLLMIVKKKGLKTEFAFGPFLIIGMIIVGIG